MTPGPRVLYVLGTRTSHGRTVRTAYRGTPGAETTAQTNAAEVRVRVSANVSPNPNPATLVI